MNRGTSIKVMRFLLHFDGGWSKAGIDAKVGPMERPRALTTDHIEALLKDGEFPESVRGAARDVVVIMTQDWCPQWHDVAAYLPAFTGQAAIFVIEYNRSPDFLRIMGFKENRFRNDEVPYLRFYRDGRLVHESNWLSREDFEEQLTSK